MTPIFPRNLSLFGLLEAIGTRVMMDFGLAGILDRVEKEFGKGPARALLVLIGMAMISGCLLLIGNFIAAAVGWFSSVPGDGFLSKAASIWWYLAGLALLILLANNWVTAIAIRRWDRLARETFDLTDETRARTNEIMERAISVSQSLEATVSRAEDALAYAETTAREALELKRQAQLDIEAKNQQ